MSSLQRTFVATATPLSTKSTAATSTAPVPAKTKIVDSRLLSAQTSATPTKSLPTPPPPPPTAVKAVEKSNDTDDEEEASDDSAVVVSKPAKKTGGKKKAKADTSAKVTPANLGYSQKVLLPTSKFDYTQPVTSNIQSERHSAIVNTFSEAITKTIKHRAQGELEYLADHERYLQHNAPAKTTVPRNLKSLLTMNLICAPTQNMHTNMQTQKRNTLAKLANLIYTNPLFAIRAQVCDRTTGTIYHLAPPHLADADDVPLQTIAQEILQAKPQSTPLAKHLRGESTNPLDWTMRQMSDTYFTMLESENCANMRKLLGTNSKKPEQLPQAETLSQQDYKDALAAEGGIFTTVAAGVVLQEYVDKLYPSHLARRGNANSTVIQSDEESEGDDASGGGESDEEADDQMDVDTRRSAKKAGRQANRKRKREPERETKKTAANAASDDDDDDDNDDNKSESAAKRTKTV